MDQNDCHALNERQSRLKGARARATSTPSESKNATLGSLLFAIRLQLEVINRQREEHGEILEADL